MAITRVPSNHTSSTNSKSFLNMPFPSASKRLESSGRSLTWPPTTVHSVRPGADENMPHINVTAPAPPAMSLIPPKNKKRPHHDPFEDEINANPAAHFLSPIQMYEYEDWAEDSDEDGEEVEWDAGITDFALFEDDRRRALERHEDVPDRWENLLASQASALQRAVQRNRADSDPVGDKSWTPLLEDVPQLTPDNSPKLRDDFDIESYCGGEAPRPSIPSYLNQYMPSDEDTDSDGSDSDEDELPVAYLVERARERRRNARKMERPGMRFNRTLSGKTHVWRRPSYHIYDVGEDSEAELRAEQLATVQDLTSTEDQRGRRR